MLCQNCNKKEANVHVTKVINGEKTEFHLCEECAKKNPEMGINFNSNMAFGMPLSFQNVVESLFEAMGGMTQIASEEESCPVCSMTFDEFRRTGKVGCGNCYSVFSNNMMPLIKRIHGNIEHTGKVPARSGESLKLKREITKLREELKNAVTNEEYENAAKLRDEIRKLEGTQN